jgi:hypothetical protein
VSESWPMDVASGMSDVIASGSVISFKGAPITVTFGPKDQRLRMTFEFGKTIAGQDLHVEQLVEGAPLRLILTNFGDPLGSGSALPIQLGTLQDRPLLLNFRVYPLRDADKTIVFTLYLVRTLASQILGLQGVSQRDPA